MGCRSTRAASGTKSRQHHVRETSTFAHRTHAIARAVSRFHPHAALHSVRRSFSLVLAMLLFVGCNEEGFSQDPLPAENVAPTELFALGQALFFDRELSGNRNIACATCHVPFLTTTEPLPLSIGEGGHGVGPTRTRSDGAILPRHTSDVFHRGDARSLLWDGRVERLDDGTIRAPVQVPDGLNDLLAVQALLPLLDRAEMRGQIGDVAIDGRPNELAEVPDDRPEEVWTRLVARIVTIPDYARRFSIVFPDEPLDVSHLVRALAHFVRAIWTPRRSRFDGLAEGRDELDAAEHRGRELFFGDAGCARCHDAPLFTDERFHALAVPVIGPGFDGVVDEGRARVTGDPRDRFRFRTPSLRNVTLTPPYMHDGAFATLEAAVRHHLDPATSLRDYDPNALPGSLHATWRPDLNDTLLAQLDDPRPHRVLHEAEVADVLAFLHALADAPELIKGPEHSVPESVPSGLPIDVWPGGPHPSR